ncbi:MAG: PEP-CTERM sorting domain-containing protein [Aquabacterium sp.]
MTKRTACFVAAIGCLLLSAASAQAAATTVDAGSFVVSYDTSTFSAGYGVFNSLQQFMGSEMMPTSQFSVSSAQDTLRITLNGTDPFPVKSGAPITTYVDVNLPLSLQTKEGHDVVYQITMGTTFSSYGQGSVTGDLTATLQGGTSPQTLASLNLAGATDGINPVQFDQTGGTLQLSSQQSLSLIDGYFTMISRAQRWQDAATTFGVNYIEIRAVAVPEPGAWPLMGMGLAGLAAVARRRARGLARLHRRQPSM